MIEMKFIDKQNRTSDTNENISTSKVDDVSTSNVNNESASKVDDESSNNTMDSKMVNVVEDIKVCIIPEQRSTLEISDSKVLDPDKGSSIINSCGPDQRSTAVLGPDQRSTLGPDQRLTAVLGPDQRSTLGQDIKQDNQDIITRDKQEINAIEIQDTIVETKTLDQEIKENKIEEKYLHVCGRYHTYSPYSYVPNERKDQIRQSTIPRCRMYLFKFLVLFTGIFFYLWNIWMILVFVIISSPESHINCDSSGTNTTSASNNTDICTTSGYIPPAFTDTSWLQTLGFPGIELILVPLIIYKSFKDPEDSVCEYNIALSTFMLANIIFSYLTYTPIFLAYVNYINTEYHDDFYGINFYLYSYASMIIGYLLLYLVHEIGRLPKTPNVCEDREEFKMIMNNTIFGIIDAITLIKLSLEIDASDASNNNLIHWFFTCVLLMIIIYGFYPLIIWDNALPARYISKLDNDYRINILNSTMYSCRHWLPLILNMTSLVTRFLVSPGDMLDLLMILKTIVFTFSELRSMYSECAFYRVG